MIFLRYNTAGQEIPIGPFLDSTDGNTEETGLAIANTDIKLWKTGGTSMVNKNSGGATHMTGGVFYAVLDATDTDTLGSLRAYVHVAGALYGMTDCLILPQAVYDWFIAGTVTNLPANVAQVAGQTANAAGAVTFPGTVASPTNITAGTLTTVTNLTNLPSIPAGWLTAAGIAAGAITSAKFAAGAIDATAIATNAIDADAIAADAVTEIQTGLATASNLSTVGTNLNSLITTVGVAGAGLTAVPVNPAIFTTTMTESYAANGAQFSLAQGLYAVHQYLQDFAITTTDYSVKKLDGSTAFSVTLNSATTPTAATRA